MTGESQVTGESLRSDSDVFSTTAPSSTKIIMYMCRLLPENRKIMKQLKNTYTKISQGTPVGIKPTLSDQSTKVFVSSVRIHLRP